MSFYPWESAPHWATHAAMDRNGSCVWYSKEPKRHDRMGHWYCEGEYMSVSIKIKPLVNIGWQYSLEESP